MCYTISINLTREFLEKTFQRKFKNDIEFTPKNVIKAFNYPDIPSVCAESQNYIDLLKWGLIPSWVKDREKAEEIRKRTFNARCETISKKPSFKNSLQKKRRCLILVDGFYEWHLEENKKIPYHIYMKNFKPFALAGLYDIWYDKEKNEEVKTFTVITTRANKLLETIHNTQKRMPVILTEEYQELWLNEKYSSAFAEKIFSPIDDSILEAKKIEGKLI